MNFSRDPWNICWRRDSSLMQEEIIELTGKDLKLRVDLSPGIST